jgi:hypothetical protein
METWKRYRKTATQEMRDYVPGEDLSGVSVAPGETPKKGGKIARDAQGSHWYVSPEFMAENYVEDDNITTTRAQKFVRHIAGHLSRGQKVICKICGKTIDEIVEEREEDE